MHTAEDVIQRLRATLYNEREWAFLPQVANATGGRYGRTADAVALNCWPSRGMELHGIEIKCYGGDFKRELSKPEKAEAIAQYCDRWFIAIPAEGIVKPNELPPTWGLIVVSEKETAIIVQAAKLDAKPLTRGFVAAVLRAAMKDEGIPLSQHQKELNERYQEGVKNGKAMNMSHSDRHRVQWTLDSLLQIERAAEGTLKSVRRELADVKKMPTEPPCEDEDPSTAHGEAN